MNYNIKILKSIADETRLNIILNLMKGSKNVSEIVKLVNKSQPNISIALGKLSDVGLISYKREKKKIVYSIKNKEFVEKILNLIKNG